jgi:hypothetical protein
MSDESWQVRSNAAWAFSRVSGRAEQRAPFLVDSGGQDWLPVEEVIFWAGGDPAMVVPALLDAIDKQHYDDDLENLCASLGAE